MLKTIPETIYRKLDLRLPQPNEHGFQDCNRVQELLEAAGSGWGLAC